MIWANAFEWHPNVLALGANILSGDDPPHAVFNKWVPVTSALGFCEKEVVLSDNRITRINSLFRNTTILSELT